jgi:BirA family transcriptional regulator, biotin operon repressor / biotin---[acetyl-CoA-carboxylase] ligase
MPTHPMPTHPMTHQPLDLTRLQKELAAAPIGHTIDYHVSIPSTMPRAHELAAGPAIATGAIVVAEEQNAGRGRLQRRWEAPPATALLISLILKAPTLPANPAVTIPMLAGVAVARALEIVTPALRGEVTLKWPNDLLIGKDLATAGKVAGILVESYYTLQEMRYAILGIGINANQSAKQLPPVHAGAPLPTSLALATGSTVDRTTLLITLCEQLAIAQQEPTAALYRAWRDRMAMLERVVAVYSPPAPTPVIGTAVDVLPDGRLLLIDGAGRRHFFEAADVSLRMPPDSIPLSE